MKVVHRPRSSAPGRDRNVDTTRKGGGFASRARSRPDATELTPAAPLADLGPLLAVREVEDDGRERRQAIDRGGQLLHELHQLRLAQVDGWLSEDTLHRLARLVERAGREVDADELASTLENIALCAGQRHRS